MRTLCQSNIPYQSAAAFYKNLSVVSEVGIVNEISNLEKAMLDFKPDLILLECQNITPEVKAFCAKNNTKLIGFGNDETSVNLLITKDPALLERSEKVFLDVRFPCLEVLSYRDKSVEKTDISVFSDTPENKFVVDFLCKNYNVKVYGKLKVNSPKYLGIPTEVEKYEIYNKSKFVLDFSGNTQVDTVLLDAYPIIASDIDLDDRLLSFDSLVGLISIMDMAADPPEDLDSKLQSLKDEMVQSSDVDFVDKFLSQIGFNTNDLKVEKGEYLSC